MRLHAINAFFGDALLLETGDGKFVLIDAGPRPTYENHVRDYVHQVAGNGAELEAVIVSHVDIDHIAGILDLFADVERAAADGDAAPFKVNDLWHNSFEQSIDDEEGSIAGGVQQMLTMAGRASLSLSSAAIAVLGIKEGAMLRRTALKLGVPLNGAFGEALISPDTVNDPVWPVGDATLRVVGPTSANLQALRTEWQQWLEKNFEAFAMNGIQALANADRSIPNLSSIVLLAANQSGTALLTGDARGDHILEGLAATGQLDGNGTLHVDVLKLQHHGSDRNVTKTFFRKVTADLYLVSADGTHGNPDFNTLKWLVEAAQEQGRNPIIVATNRTASTDRLLAELPPAQNGYTLHIRDPNAHAIVVDVATASVV